MTSWSYIMSNREEILIKEKAKAEAEAKVGEK